MVVDFRNEPFTDFSKEENRRAFEEALETVRAQLGREYDLIIGGERIRRRGGNSLHQPVQCGRDDRLCFQGQPGAGGKGDAGGGEKV